MLIIVFLNALAISIFTLINGWNVLSFLRFFLLGLMFEGLILALIGGLSFFGFEKYATWLESEIKLKAKEERTAHPSVKRKSKMNWGELLVTVGVLVFFGSFSCFSLIF